MSKTQFSPSAHLTHKMIGVIVGPCPADALEYNELVYREIGRHRQASYFTWAFSHCFAHASPGLHHRFAGVSATEQCVIAAADALLAPRLTHVLVGVSALSVFSEQVGLRVNVPVCDLCTVTARALHRFKLFPAGLLGVRSSVESDFWARRMQECGGEAVCLSESQRMQVAQLLDRECQADIARAGLVGVVESLRRSGARSVVLCTPGIRRILREEDSLLPLTCAAEQQIKAAVARAADAIEADV